jgi:hypothetical protein
MTLRHPLRIALRGTGIAALLALSACNMAPGSDAQEEALKLRSVYFSAPASATLHTGLGFKADADVWQ